jgi:hypothetical protein
MEYDHVLVVGPATISDRGPAGLGQFYVALTRSTQSLTVLHRHPVSAAGNPASSLGSPGRASRRPHRVGPEQLTAAVEPFGIGTGQVWGKTEDARGANRRGIERARLLARYCGG